MIRELYAEYATVKRDYQHGRAGEFELRQAQLELGNSGEDLRVNLPVDSVVAYAEKARSRDGEYHIVLNDEFRSGRLYRDAGDTLCAGKDRFSTLSLAENDLPTCLRCLELAERILEREGYV